MRNLTSAFAALLLIVLSFAGPILAAGAVPCADAVGISAETSVRDDGRVDTGAFIKPEVAPRAATERSEGPPKELEGADVEGRRGSCPFSPNHFLQAEPAPSSASVRRAFLHVYRL